MNHPEILIVDNYDSFVYNIAQYLGELGASVTVLRNDSDRIQDCIDSADGFILSPGPGHPRDSRKTLDIASNDGFGKPVLGVCLGHQAIAHANGASVGRATRVVHGKVCEIRHKGDDLFKGIPERFHATRYHSLVVERDTLPDRVRMIADNPEGEVMAIRIESKPVFGVQFHPESVMTSNGKTILSNFLGMCEI